MKIKPNSIKKSIIEWVFNRKTIKYSIYLSFGFFLSQFSNIMVYYLQGSSNVDTLFSLTNTLNRLPMFYASILSVSLCIFIFLIFQLIFPSLIQRSANKLLRNGLIIGLFFIFISQLLFTSIMRLVYEFSFYIIVISSLLIQKLWIKQPRPNEKSRFDEIKFHYNEIWDLLKVSIPMLLL